MFLACRKSGPSGVAAWLSTRDTLSKLFIRPTSAWKLSLVLELKVYNLGSMYVISKETHIQSALML